MTKRIEICGGIATGKTTLANLIYSKIDYKSSLIKENFKDNPYWVKFYSDPERYAFEKNISFQLIHGNQIYDDKNNNDYQICDFALFQDLAYAKMSNDERHINASITVNDYLKNRSHSPYAIIYLKCHEEEQLNRIRQRDRKQEQYITIEYLAKLNGSINDCLTSEPNSYILKIDSNEIDFRNGSEGVNETLDILKNNIEL